MSEAPPRAAPGRPPWRPPWRMLCPVCETHWLTVSPAQPHAECPGGHLTARYDPVTERITLIAHAAQPAEAAHE